jgi:MFS family permease
MVWRFVQALGASPGLAVGSGVIGDIYKLEERGQAMGIFFGVSFLSLVSECLFS